MLAEKLCVRRPVICGGLEPGFGSNMTWSKIWSFYMFKGKMSFHLSKNIGLIICVRFLKIKRNIYDFNENRHLGGILQFSTALLDLPSTTPSSETDNSITNFASVTILNYTLTFMTITLILAIKNSHCIIYCRETDCWTKTPSSSIISQMTPWSKSKADWWHLKLLFIYSVVGNIYGSMKKSSLPFSSICTALYSQIYRMLQRANFWK